MIDALDHSGTSALGSAVSWVEGTLLGTAATIVAIIAVASVGLLMLTGRIDVRRAGQVIFGCFIIFGASAIASGIIGAASGSGASADPGSSPGLPPPPILPSPPAQTQSVPSAYDPYAGAALLTRN